VVLPLSVAVVGILAVFAFANRGISEPTVESTVSRYAEALRAIGTEVPVPADPEPNWRERARDRLASVEERVQTVESMVRDLEHLLATRSSGCTLAKAAGDTIGKELVPARVATSKALDGLLSETKDRLKALETENNTLGWVGWRGSREEAISGLTLLLHEIKARAADADLVFARLENNGTVLSRMSLTCQASGPLRPS
jgi:hypothetical protein